MRIFPNRYSPNFIRLKNVLMRKEEPDLVPFFEVLIDKPVMETILGRSIHTIQDLIDIYLMLGYDYVMINDVPGIEFPKFGIEASRYQEEGSISKRHRSFHTSKMNSIASWNDFETYPWPEPEKIDYSVFEELDRLLPDGMKAIVGAGLVFETTLALFGVETFAYMTVDNPELLEAVFERVGSIYQRFYRNCCEFSSLGAVLIADDLGFKTQTTMSPKELRRLVFPWYRRYTDICHSYDKPVILHSCGNLSAVMEDIIQNCRLDAKHSYEDEVMPVTEAKKLYGDRVGILGGIDVHFLVTASPNEVRKRTWEILEECSPGGGYAIGTGNSVAEYIPVENYLAMLDAANDYGR